jgi:hypothetical protein
MKFFTSYRLRRAARLHAEWKARAEAESLILARSFFSDFERANRVIRAAGKEAYYAEAVEQLMRD